jgi:hypothetical protein
VFVDSKICNLSSSVRVSRVFFLWCWVSRLLLLGRRLKIQIQQSNEEKSNATKVIQLYVPYWLDTKKCPPLKYKLVAIGQHADKKGEYTGDLGLRKLKALSADAAADLDQMENSPTMLSSFDCRSLELSVALANSAEAVFGPGTPLQALDEAVRQNPCLFILSDCWDTHLFASRVLVANG